jgi:hypothetical protein
MIKTSIPVKTIRSDSAYDHALEWPWSLYIGSMLFASNNYSLVARFQYIALFMYLTDAHTGQFML